MAAAAPVVANFSQAAGQNIDNASADALNAVAQSGSAGKAALANAAQQNAASKTQALKSAIAYAALRGAPAGNSAANAATVAAPFDNRAADTAMMQQNYGANNANMAQANANFFAGAKAGLPIAESALQRTISNDQAANASKAQSLAAAIATKNIDAQIAGQNLLAAQARAQTAGSAGALDTPAKIIAALGGAGTAGAVLGQAAGTLDPYTGIDNTTGRDANGFSARTGGVQGPAGLAAIGQHSLDQAYGAVGLPAGYEAPLGQAATSAGLTVQNKQNTANRPASNSTRLTELATSAPDFAATAADANALVVKGANPTKSIQALAQKWGYNIADATLIYNQAVSQVTQQLGVQGKQQSVAANAPTTTTPPHGG